MKSKHYSLSFTTGALMHRESIRIAEQYAALQDWEAVRKQVIAENLLQTRTQNTLHRFCREVISRLKLLTEAEMTLLVTGSLQEQRYLLWLAICRRYEFIGDFAREVIHERYLSLALTLTPSEFDSFFNRKSEWHDELERITPTTRHKLRQILFKMLREADLLSKADQINPALLSERLTAAIVQIDRQNLLLFPLFATTLATTATRDSA